MSYKTDSSTPILLIGFAVVLVLSHFFNPLDRVFEQFDVWNNTGYSGVQVFLLQRFIQIFMPLLSSFAEILSYMGACLVSILSADAGNGSNASAFLATFLIFIGYVVVVHMLETIHSEWHDNEGLFTICINMLCLENIVMYVFNVIAYFFYKLIMSWRLPEWVFYVGLFTIGLFGLWIMLFYLLYFLIGFIISLSLPFILACIGSGWNTTVLCIVLLIAMLFSSQVLWRLSSSHVYKVLFGICTLHKVGV